MKLTFMLDFQQKEKTMEKYFDLLAHTPLFESIDHTDIPVMLKCLQAHKQNYPKESLIRQEGDAADFIGIVLKGSIQILQYDYNGNRNINASFSEGDMFAEALSCAEIPSLPFSILAMSDCDILFFNKNKILHQCSGACEFHNQLIQNLLKIVAQKNMKLNQKLYYLSRKTTAEKILCYLDDQARLHHSNEFTIPFDRQALADYLGVERSAMSAELSKLQKQGLLETKRNYFKLNPDYSL